jgi:hypothetical protein
MIRAAGSHAARRATSVKPIDRNASPDDRIARQSSRGRPPSIDENPVSARRASSTPRPVHAAPRATQCPVLA